MGFSVARLGNDPSRPALHFRVIVENESNQNLQSDNKIWLVRDFLVPRKTLLIHANLKLSYAHLLLNPLSYSVHHGFYTTNLYHIPHNNQASYELS